MTPRSIRLITTALFLQAVVIQALFAQPALFRPPSIPLITCDPYFSIWSATEHPADSWPKHWTGATQALCGMVRIDGKPYRILGASPSSINKMTLRQTRITPTRTIYTFGDAGVEVVLTFTNPLLPWDLSLVSRPAGYISWQVISTDRKEHEVSLYIDASAELVVNTPDEKVIWSRVQRRGLDVLKIGSVDQPVLGKSGDDIRIDWGYLYMAAKSDAAVTSVATGHESARGSFAHTGILPGDDDLRMPRQADDDWPVLAFSRTMTIAPNASGRWLVTLLYDDLYSIEYLNRRLNGYWKSTGMTVGELIDRSTAEFDSLSTLCAKFDDELTADMKSAGGDEYAAIGTLAYREAFAAHKLAADVDGTPMLFPKENFSNGCISTVDVIYPAAPIFLLLNNNLLKATLTPVMNYSMLKRWKFPFAPHDIGTYPLANGQVYGGGEETAEDQMPVEESGNMLILLYAAARTDGNAAYAGKYWASVEKWARFLKEKGLDPENQLCTDDFAGHLAHNVNLSLKAIIALGCYSKLCEMEGKDAEAKEYWSTAVQYSKKWELMANDGDHYKLAFDKPGTWSQKYNLVWDKILGLNLFPQKIASSEIAFYQTKLNQYGLPLDNRKDYTKTDWQVWTASLAEKRDDFERLIAPVYDFVNKTTPRVPLTDWYDTKTAAQVGFQARPVIGGMYIKLLTDEAVWKKWRGRIK
jgi:hypothetical protein